MSLNRILHLRASNFVGGPENQLLRHGIRERSGGWEIWIGVYVGSGEGREFLIAADRLEIHSISLPVESAISSVLTLRRILEEKKIRVLCTHGYKADVIGVLAGQLARVPVACFLRGWTGESPKVSFYDALDRFSLRFADRIVCLSNLQAEKISLKHDLSRKVRIVRNAIDAPNPDSNARSAARNELNQLFQLPERCLVIATAGRLSPEKGVGDFLDAAAQIRSDGNNLRFVVFGEGSLREELERKATSLGLGRCVVFAGFQPNLRSLLPGIDILVNPSHAEEMPNIVLEGMASTVPVVATDVGGVREIAGPYRAVKLVPPGKPGLLAEAISGLANNPADARVMGQMGFERVKQAFCLESQRQQFQMLYHELVTEGKSISNGD